MMDGCHHFAGIARYVDEIFLGAFSRTNTQITSLNIVADQPLTRTFGFVGLLLVKYLQAQRIPT